MSKLIKVTEFNEDGHFIAPDVIQAHPLTVGAGEVWQIIAAKKSLQQDLSMRFWISSEAGGLSLPEVFKNLNVISLLDDPTVVYIAEESTNASDVPTDPATLLVSQGEFWLNIQNVIGIENKYLLLPQKLT